jgi:hypothetical protein
MDLSEHILLSDPALMLTILKAAQDTASLEDCLRRLQEDLARAREALAPMDAQELLAHMRELRDEMIEARLLAPLEGERFAATARGREVLAAYPQGIDESVLMRFAEFRDFLHRSVRHPPRDDPRGASYDEGYAAYLEGLRAVENPYPPDTIDHLAWENGWFEASDEAAEHEPGS